MLPSPAAAAHIGKYLNELENEEYSIACESACTTLWSQRLRQQLILVERFFLAHKRLANEVSRSSLGKNIVPGNLTKQW